MYNYAIVFWGILELIFKPIIIGGLLLILGLLILEGIKSIRKKITYRREC